MTNVDTRATSAGFKIDQLYEYALLIRAKQTHAISQLLETLEGTRESHYSVNFGDLIRVSQKLLEISDAEMARILKVSRPTIGRWVRSETMPHELTQHSINAELIKKAREKIKIVRD